MRLFWRHGYEGVSFGQLTAALGIAAPSLYAAFGNKAALYREALDRYERWLPLINYENRQCGLLAAKALMKEGGVIRSDAPRQPLLPLHPATRAGLLEIAATVQPLALRWGK